MEFEDFREQVRAERKVRAQRDAAERNLPLERLRREIREAFERKDARDRADAPTAGRLPEEIRDSHS